MKHLKKILIGIIIISSLFIAVNVAGGYVTRETYKAPPAKVEAPKELTTHAQKVWISALEWCESKGKPGAVNEKDRDGTASYYSFQFKPGTFRHYGVKYGVISSKISESGLMEKMKDQKTQQLIVEHMVKDQKNIKWEQQFPVCVKKLGRPPTY